MALHPAEEATFRAFVAADKRDRFLALFATPKRRKRARDSLNHFAAWDPRRVQSVTSSTDVLAVLRRAGAPSMCHVIADDVALDGADLPLADAVAAAEACSFASVLCGLPGQVAFFFDEMAAPRVRLLLRQPGSAREPANALDGPASRRKFVFGIVSLGASRWPPQIVIRYPAMQRPGTCILGIVMAAVATLLRLNVAHIFRACWAGAPSIGADYQTMMAWIDIFNIAIITGLSVAAAGWLVPRRPPGAG